MEEEIASTVDPWAQSFEELHKALECCGATFETMQSGEKTKAMILQNLDLFKDRERVISIFRHLFPKEKINA